MANQNISSANHKRKKPKLLPFTAQVLVKHIHSPQMEKMSRCLRPSIGLSCPELDRRHFCHLRVIAIVIVTRYCNSPLPIVTGRLWYFTPQSLEQLKRVQQWDKVWCTLGAHKVHTAH